VPYYGSSLILAISFEGGVPTAQGLLTYSQSADPASPHHADQTERFSRKEWIAFPTTPAAIGRDPALVATRIEE
jgi:acyl-homoserine-lactone acylase